MKRQPAVAGSFYPETCNALTKTLKRLVHPVENPKKVICAIAPHAGYIYSGEVAGRIFSEISVPEKCIVLSPNHHRYGARAAIMAKGSWVIPTGEIPVDEEICSSLLQESTELRDDISAHLREHSLEVELPFLLARQPKLRIAPITISLLGASGCAELAYAIARVISKSSEEILIVCSTDMNHFDAQAETMEKDRMAIEKVLDLDASGLIETCSSRSISMCGVIPTAVSIMASLELGAKKATLIEHKTSGDVTGDYTSVVGYAGFIIE